MLFRSIKLLKDAKLVRQNRKLEYIASSSEPKPGIFDKLAAVYTRKQEHDKHALEQMVGYAVSGFCRWKLILEYFDDKVAGFEHCCKCDNCLNPPALSLTDGIEIRDDEFDHAPVAQAPAPKFIVGARARSSKYGEGVVTGIAGDQVTLDFTDGESRTFMVDFLDPV